MYEIIIIITHIHCQYTFFPNLFLKKFINAAFSCISWGAKGFYLEATSA